MKRNMRRSLDELLRDAGMDTAEVARVILEHREEVAVYWLDWAKRTLAKARDSGTHPK